MIDNATEHELAAADHREEINDNIGILSDNHVRLHCRIFKSLERLRVLQTRNAQITSQPSSMPC